MFSLKYQEIKMSKAVLQDYLAIHSETRAVKTTRIESIDLLRGVVMIIMALDHVRDYFHYDAFMYDPTDLSQTNPPLFFTRWITHYCAPVFVFLAGVSAYLYGAKRNKKQLSYYLFTRGFLLMLIELFVVGLFRTFNPTFPHFTLQVIWAIGICMIALSALIYLNLRVILLIGILIMATHNLLDSVHVPGNNLAAILWSILHDVKWFSFGQFTLYVHYPVLAWIGVMATGYFFGSLYVRGYDPQKRRRFILMTGIGAIVLFIILRSGNFYGDAANWSLQKNFIFSVLSFLNVSKYPPSLLYILITLGPALIFLSFSEKPLNELREKIVVFGRVPMFYYLAHILLIHIFASIAGVLTGYPCIVVISKTVNSEPCLKGYGFGLLAVYLVWIILICILFPLCKRFDLYKRANQSKYSWLSYL